MVDTIGSPTLNTAKTGTAQLSTAETDAEKTSADFENFLLLMTTQMKNQDPLKPIDSTQFVSQLAQFSTVEQQVKMNANLEKVISGLNVSQFEDSLSYLGKTVTSPSGKIAVKDEPVNFSYQTGATATSAQALVTDEFGSPVRKFTLNTSAGVNNIKWNLKDDAGNQVDPGVYNIQIVEQNGSGEPATSLAIVAAKLTEARKDKDGTVLFKTEAGGEVKLADIIGIQG